MQEISHLDIRTHSYIYAVQTWDDKVREFFGRISVSNAKWIKYKPVGGGAERLIPQQPSCKEQFFSVTSGPKSKEFKDLKKKIPNGFLETEI